LGNRYRTNKDVIARQVAGETLLVPIRGDLASMACIFALDGVAEHLWQHLEGGATLDQMVGGVVSQFEVTRQEARTDIEEFLAQLLEEGLIGEES
jgi:hypothetical protein